jgi:heme-degrading monooxygenase HmoA
MEVDMYARNVSLRLKANNTNEFTRTFEKEVVPLLRKQTGFQDEIICGDPGGQGVVAISLWDNKEHADAYNSSGYPQVLKLLNAVLDGTPRVQSSNVLSSTIQAGARRAA